MNWWGKLIGGALGFAIGGPIGALLGVAIGHGFDGKAALNWSELGNGADAGRVQTVFFTSVFSVMGHLAKADGRVSEREIGMARAVMQHMRLNRDQTEAAIRLFSEGKRPGFPLEEVLAQFKRECRQRMLYRMFLEIQLQAAMADGAINADERQVLQRICAVLGIGEWELEQLEALIRMQQGRAGGAGGRTAPRRDEVAEAYRVLGVEKSAGDAEVKRAYRKLMSQHHPDKLAAKGLPEEMLQGAQERAQEITRAYDVVKEARGMK